MKSLKVPPSLHSSHGGKTLIPFPNRKLALSGGLFTRTITLFSPSIFPSGHCDLKEACRMQFSMSSTSASIQPMSEKLMGDTSKNLPVSGDSIRRRFLSFYASHGHKVLPSTSLVPDDPTVLLTIAGMLQLKPIFLEKDLGDDTRFIEYYNLVFMQYNKKEDGSLEPLKQRNIDTGLGLERVAHILQKVSSNYETDLIYPIIEKTSELANVSYSLADNHIKMNLKIIGEHLRAILYLILDGVFPSNIGRGFVVRRLIRRAVHTGRLLGIKGDGRGNLEGAFLPVIAEKVIEISTHIDVDVKGRSPCILELKREELRFVQMLERGEKLLDEMLVDALSRARENGTAPCLSGKDAFLL